jgi:chromosome condensin MukBEF complex kleisin-like MukF subunit
LKAVAANRLLQVQETAVSVDTERLKYAQKLNECILAGRNLNYIHETTLNSNMRLDRVWQYEDKPVDIVLGKRIGGLTIYGAICNYLKAPVFTLDASTNTNEYKSFM